MRPRVPIESSGTMWSLVGSAGMLSLLGFIEAIAVAKKFAAKGRYSIGKRVHVLGRVCVTCVRVACGVCMCVCVYMCVSVEVSVGVGLGVGCASVCRLFIIS